MKSFIHIVIHGLVCLVVTACTSGCGSAGSSSGGTLDASVKNQKPVGGTLVVFGDSLAVGTGAQQESSKLASCLGGLLNWPDWSPYGRNGATSADGVRDLDGLLKLNPKIVVVSLGGNDVLRSTFGQPIAADETFKNLKTIYKALTAKGILVVHMGLAPPFRGAERLPAIKNVAESEGVLFVPDVLSGMWGTSEFMSDSIHPNDKGYLLACDRLATAMKPYL